MPEQELQRDLRALPARLRDEYDSCHFCMNAMLQRKALSKRVIHHELSEAQAFQEYDSFVTICQSAVSEALKKDHTPARKCGKLLAGMSLTVQPK